MNDSLILRNRDLPEEREGAISRQFYEWERRGRGWQVYHFPVELEPPFRPFFYFEPDDSQIIDDGRIPSFFSRLIEGNPANTENAVARRDGQLEEYAQYIAEADEPEFCRYYQDEFIEMGLVLPVDFKTSKPVSEQLLLSLTYAAHPISFEIIGNSEQIVVQFAATKCDIAQLKQQLESHLPSCHLLESEHFGFGDRLSATWLNAGDLAIIVDFGLSEEFILPLDTVTGFDVDPLSVVIGAMSDLADDETAVIQVLFQKCRNDWRREIIDTIHCFDQTGLFEHIPDIKYLVKKKLSSPLFSAVVRVAGKSSHNGRSMEIVRNLGGALARFGTPPGNEFIPLSNEGYEAEHHEQALLNRQSFRCGMLLNTEELVSLVHPPSLSVQSRKMFRDTVRTKSLPEIAKEHSLVLGENSHRGQTEKVTLSNDQRTRHLHLIGSSGSGKSTLLLGLIKQDLENGHGLCVIDPHGDLIDSVIGKVPEDRRGDVILFDPSDAEYPIGFNILQAKTELEKTILSSDLVGTFRRMSTSWGDVMDSVLANAILAFVESDRGGTLLDLKRFLVERNFRDEFLETVADDSVRYFWSHEFPLITNKPQASILIRLDTFLRQRLIRNIVCQRENKLDLRTIMDDRKVLLVKLSQGLIGEENAYLLGTLFVSKLYQAALGRQETPDRPYFWLYMDEFQHFITPSMENILSGSRKYNLGLILAHQEFRQLQSRNQEVASSVVSNCYTRICFRLGDRDAENFASGFSYFDSRDLQNLGVGEAIARIERAEFDFNLSVTPVPKIDAAVANRRRSEIVGSTREKYAEPRQDIESALFAERNVESSDNAKEKPAAKAPTLTKQKPADTADGQHRYLQSIIKRIGEGKGFVATVEKEVFGGVGKVDVVLENEHHKIACEIAVTNTVEYELQNIQKCLNSGFDRVAVISPDAKHLLKIRRSAENRLTQEQLSQIHFLEPESFHLFLESLASSESNDIGQQKVKGYRVITSFKQSSELDTRATKQTILDVIENSARRKGKSKHD